MTISNLETRVAYWSKHANRGPAAGHDLVDSLPYPWELLLTFQNAFDGEGVLEIGPGNGRQYERLCRRAMSYCLADISIDAMSAPIFDGVAAKFVIADWGQSLGMMFDVIHFWYVLHHVTHSEMQEFFEFIGRHLRDGGLAIFNCPVLCNVQGAPDGDGIGTTYSDPDFVNKYAAPLSVVEVVHVGMKSTGWVIVLRKAQT